MNLPKLINLSILIQATFAHICTDDWELVYVKEGPVCWALLSVPDFSSNFQSATKVCESANAKVVTVQNSAERAVFADLANRVSEPTLSCYKVSNFAVEGQFKSIDFERPPEYLRILNQQGRVKLSRGLRKGDRISIGFSLKLAIPENGLKMKILEGNIFIGNSSNSSHYSIKAECSIQPNGTCYFKHPETPNPGITVTFFEEKIRAKLTAEYFGKFNFDFMDRAINIWDRKLILPSKYSYVGMDEISIGNISVSSVEHSESCVGMEEYSFERKNLMERNMTKQLYEPVDIPAPRRALGSNYTFLVPESRFDYHNIDGVNSIFFDVRVSQAMKGDIFINWSYVSVEFWSRGSNQSIFKVIVNNKNGLTTEYLTINGQIKKTNTIKLPNAGQLENIRLLDFRFKITTSGSINMDIKTTIQDVHFEEIEMPFRNFDEIRLQSDKGIFYDIEMNPLQEVTMMTCNNRKPGLEMMDETVPYRPYCFKERNILCQKEAANITDEIIPNEPDEIFVWTEEAEEERKAIESSTIIVDKPKELRKEKEEKEEKEKVEEDIQVNNIDGFQWSIVALTTLSAASFIAIIILNIIRCWI